MSTRVKVLSREALKASNNKPEKSLEKETVEENAGPSSFAQLIEKESEMVSSYTKVEELAVRSFFILPIFYRQTILRMLF